MREGGGVRKGQRKGEDVGEGGRERMCGREEGSERMGC